MNLTRALIGGLAFSLAGICAAVAQDAPAAPPPAYRSTPSYPATTQAAVAPPTVAQPYVPPPPPMPPQSQIEPGLTSVPRPPMPVQQP